ncbi:MAG TPA: DUF2268 domain-containing putative Zn-dependent protease [Lentimicrobium sp.]|nr:DUF2268 domain-containing putative Zn-dependent protease [Lentimicrobium sp.]
MSRLFLYSFIGVLFITSCKSSIKPNEDSSGTQNGIRRYEVDLFNIDTNSFEEGLRKILPDYKVFLGQTMPDKSGIGQLKEFVTDPLIRETYAFTMKQYPDVQWLNEAFDKGFVLLKKEMPAFVVPQVYTYISGFDIQMPVKYSDSALIIGLDLYLGKDFYLDKKLGYPLYITNRLEREFILPDSFKEIAWAHLPELQSATLLDAMIEQGKLIYFTELLLPDSKANTLIKYTPQQLDWVVSNEQNLWTFIIDNQLLYSSDPKAITMFMTDGPFTSGFSEESPSRTGHWIGWQIVRKYMQNNDVSLEDLLKDTDSQKILQQSGYKPARV